MALYLTLQHSEAPPLSDFFASFCPRPRGLAPSTRIVTLPCTAQIPAGTVVACSTRLHQTSSIDMVRLVVACIHHDAHDSTVSLLLHPTRQFHFCGSCSHAANKPPNCNQLSPTSDMADVSPSSSRCITTSTSTTQTSTVFLIVWMVGTWRCTATGTSTIRSTIHFVLRSWGNDLDHSLFLPRLVVRRRGQSAPGINRTTSATSSMTWRTYSIVTCAFPFGRNHRKSPFLRTSINFFLCLITRVPEHS